MSEADLIERLRADLASAGYTASAVTAVWGPAADEALARGTLLPAARASSGAQTPVALLARLFLLGLVLTEAEIAAALPSLGAGGATALGLVRPAASGHASDVELRPIVLPAADGVDEWWILSDPGEARTGGALPEDFVLGVGGATRTLLGLQLPRPASSVLDLGTGCGVQALRAARYADTVVATDLSERALRYARLTAALNGVTAIEFRLGSLFDPVAGERFDRIVSNPPFVITPRAAGVPAYAYRDGGREGDGLVEAVVRGTASALRPGGIAQLLANWEDHGTEDGIDRVLQWADEAGLDVWAVERESLDPVSYAETWIRDGGTRRGDPAHDRLLGAWLDDFAARGVRSIGFGYLTLRLPRSGTPRLRRAERIPGPVGDGLGAHLAACLEADDWLAAHDDEALLAARLVVAGDVTEERHHWPGEEHPTVLQLRQGGGFGRIVPLDAALGGLVGASDGELTVRAILGAVGTILAEDAARLRVALLPQLRELIATGMLLPAV